MRIVMCQWLDAKVDVDGGIPDLPVMTSIGYLYHKDKHKTIIASLTGTNDEPRITQVVPTCLVKSIKFLDNKLH